MIAALLQGGADGRVSGGVAEGHGDVAQPAFMTEAAQRAAFGTVQEFLFTPGEQIDESGRVQAVTRQKIAFRRVAGMTVPRADQLAVVTAVDAVAEQRAQRFGNGAVRFDGEVGDAQPCVHRVGRDDGARGADVEAGRAAPAVGAYRVVCRQRQVGVDLAEKEPGTLTGEQVAVFAHPAEAGLGGDGFFQYRRAVTEHAVAIGTDDALDLRGEFLQTRADQFVIVAAQGITRDVAVGAVVQDLPGVGGGGQIIHARADDAAGAGHQFRRAAALAAVLRHVAHFTVMTGGEPLIEPGFGRRQIDVADAHLLKTERRPPVTDLPHQGGVVVRVVVVEIGHAGMIPVMSILPHDLYRAAQVRELERIAMAQCGLSDGVLLERAGRAAFELLRRRWPEAHRIAVVCGVGNNGGDGFVLARLARAAGLEVALYQVGEAARLRGAALAAAQAVGLTAQPLAAGALRGCDVVVDALLGIGLRGEVRGAWRTAIDAINGSGRPVLALDLPSGLDADTGAVLDSAVQASVTLTFLGLKPGLLTAAGPACGGELRFASLAVPPAVYAKVPAAARRLDSAQFAPWLAPRRRDAHKGDCGHVLVVGGDLGYAGAVRLAAEAAARCGAGLVSVATRAAHAAAIAMARPELMCHGVERAVELEPLLRRATVVVIGPGLGQGAWGRHLLGKVLQARQPLVVDADALNLLAQDPLHRKDWVLTPHPGEAGRLLGATVAQVQADRFAAAAGLQASFGGVVVLKGAGTVVLGGDGLPGICVGGNPGMASGGMGDVLSGVIAALLAQGLPLREAAGAGVCLHAAAADTAAAEAGERGLLASDLFRPLHRLVNPR